MRAREKFLDRQNSFKKSPPEIKIVSVEVPLFPRSEVLKQFQKRKNFSKMANFVPKNEDNLSDETFKFMEKSGVSFFDEDLLSKSPPPLPQPQLQPLNLTLTFKTGMSGSPTLPECNTSTPKLPAIFENPTGNREKEEEREPDDIATSFWEGRRTEDLNWVILHFLFLVARGPLFWFGLFGGSG